jgi:sulfite reductase (NADPH) flavoprotein alpha-component
MSGELKHAFIGRHRVNVRLTGPASEKVTRHHEIAIEAPPVTYLPGDALGVHPRNDPALVDRILARVNATGDEEVAVPDLGVMPLRQALSDVYNLNTPSRRLLELLAARGADDLAPLLERANADKLRHYLSDLNDTHDVLDVLDDHPQISVSGVEFADTLRKTLPRLYSVASSQKAHPGEVHLLVVSVLYTVRERDRLGVCSTWLADRWPIGATADMYLQNQQKHFAMPASGDTPMIMIGPGTGLAPFRAFIEERRVLGARGPNWLFFGEQRRSSDFFYESELAGYERDGLLRLSVAFSRDQAHKIYVQHRMRDEAADIWPWLEDGAEIFVCGDKNRMAADVDRELHAIVEIAGGKTADEAHEYIERLKHEKRYKRDVY